MPAEIRRLRPDDGAALAKVLALGRTNAKYLRFMPKGGYLDRVDKGTLLVACRQGEVVGYVLYDLPRSVVHIAHVCVDQSCRRTGIARDLIREISARHADRRGVELLVRNDFPAYDMWFRLGFSPKTEMRGRGAAGKP